MLAFATDRGGYNTTWALVIRTIGVLTPEHAPLPEDNRTLTLSMYQINAAVRRAAHVAAYATFALLVVRTIQWGRPRLQVGAVLGMLAFCGLLTGAESLVRLKLATGRHVRWEQFYLNLIGAGLALVLTLIFFGVKALERRMQNPEPPLTE